AYAGLCRLQNVPDEMLQPVLLINCPTLTFPFLRRLVADITREGGFLPLMLDPIDFAGLYAQNMEKAKTSGQAPANPSAAS
ncbi:MAG: protein-export chaperone SecB, partial [Hyphomicrobiaceae bacterium]